MLSEFTQSWKAFKFQERLIFDFHHNYFDQFKTSWKISVIDNNYCLYSFIKLIPIRWAWELVPWKVGWGSIHNNMRHNRKVFMATLWARNSQRKLSTSPICLERGGTVSRGERNPRTPKSAPSTADKGSGENSLMWNTSCSTPYHLETAGICVP